MHRSISAPIGPGQVGVQLRSRPPPPAFRPPPTRSSPRSPMIQRPVRASEPSGFQKHFASRGITRHIAPCRSASSIVRPSISLIWQGALIDRRQVAHSDIRRRIDTFARLKYLPRRTVGHHRLVAIGHRCICLLAVPACTAKPFRKLRMKRCASIPKACVRDARAIGDIASGPMIDGRGNPMMLQSARKVFRAKRRFRGTLGCSPANRTVTWHIPSCHQDGKTQPNTTLTPLSQ